MPRLAAVVDKAEIDRLGASGREIEVLKKDFGNRFVLVVTGIRLDTVFMTKKSRDFNRRCFLGAGYLVR